MKSCSFLILIMTFMSACSSPTKNPAGVETISESRYLSEVKQRSQSTKRYKGLHNTLEVGATLLSSQMIESQLRYRAHLFQWDQTTFTEEQQTALKDSNLKSQIFISFYTPERKMNDLHKNNSLWKIFIDIDGRRFEGRAEKINLPTAEVASFYPYHTRFSTPYLVTFPAPLDLISRGKVQLTLTSSLDSATLEF